MAFFNFYSQFKLSNWISGKSSSKEKMMGSRPGEDIVCPEAGLRIKAPQSPLLKVR
jgi:hypothetical protein